MAGKPPVPRRLGLVLLPALVLTGIAWAMLRINLEERLPVAAQRDLQTLVELVAADLSRLVAADPSLQGEALARKIAGSGSLLDRSLQRASEERFRHVYFFDVQGRIVPTGDPAPAVEPPLIVQLALAGPTTQGSLSEPYRDQAGEEVIGAWYWLATGQLGVVAERPYERLAQPVAWVDGSFAALLAALVAGAFFGGFRSWAELRSAFRRADIHRCGPYRIERLIGEGAMSNVYLACHEQLGRRVALKRLKLQTQSDELSARFDREARLASRLAHPNIVTILDHGPVPEGGFYYTMEFIDGLTLTQWVEQHGPLPPARAVRLLQQICAAVAAMHEAGLLHRDIKPDNVMAHAAHGDYDLVKLLDFGLIKDLEARQTRDLTGNVRVLGTPAYMAPERLLDPRSIDPRTDVYGIGCIGFYLLAGRRPFEARADADLSQQVLHVPAPPVAPLSPFPVPEALEGLIGRCLEKDMARRPASAQAMSEELARIARQVPWRRERAKLWWESLFTDRPAG